MLSSTTLPVPAYRNRVSARSRFKAAMRIYVAPFISVFIHVIIVSSLAGAINVGSDPEQPVSKQASTITPDNGLAKDANELSPISHGSYTPPDLGLDDKIGYGLRLDFDNVCFRLWRRIGNQDIHYTTKKIVCDQHDRQKRAVYITCAATIATESIGQFYGRHPKDDVVVPDDCPMHTVCQPIFLLGEFPGAQQEDIGCVGEQDINTDVVTISAIDDPRASHNYEHCSVPMELPGLHWSAPEGHTSIDVVLSEQVKYLNGSNYAAPALFIREKRGRFKSFDRVYRADASVASAEIELSTYRGKWQTREFEFCMTIVPVKVATPVFFTYSFLQVPRRR